MKRHRNSTGFCETAEDELYSPNKKSAEALDGSQFGGPGIGASRSSPQLPLTRPDGAFSPRTLHHHATAPLPIRAVLQEDTENHAALMSFSPHALKIPICSTPEELKSPHLHTPPPRPNKSSPPGSAAAKATHPQTEVTHVPLQELVTRIKLRPCTLRRIVSSTSQKNPNRPKPVLSRNATVADVSRTRETQADSAILGDSGTQGRQLGRVASEREGPHFGSPTSRTKAVRQASTRCEATQAVGMTRAYSESKVARDVTIDPTLGKGMFHQATLSKPAVRTSMQGGQARHSANQGEWIEGRRYNPYELVRDANKSGRSGRPSRHSDVSSPVRLPSPVVITPPFKSPSMSASMMASPTANVSSVSLRTSASQGSHLLASPPLNRDSGQDADHELSSLDGSCVLHFEESDDDNDMSCFVDTADSHMTVSEEVLEVQEMHLTEARPIIPSFARSSSTRRFNAYNASTFAAEMPFSQPEMPDDLSISTRDQLFAMEMGDESSPAPNAPFASILRAPGPTAW